MLIDLHNHTLPRSLDSSLRADDLVRLAKERGLDGVCLTEHDNSWDSREMEGIGKDHGFPVLAGMEVNTDHGHILVFGLTKYTYEMFSAKRLREIVDQEGGVMILAHPYRRSLYSPGPSLHRFHPNGDRPWAATDQDYSTLIHAVEALNGSGGSSDNAFSLEVARRLGLPGTGGSDAHVMSEVAKAATDFERKITSLSDFIAAVKEGNLCAVDMRVGKASPL